MNEHRSTSRSDHRGREENEALLPTRNIDERYFLQISQEIYENNGRV